MDVQEEWNFGGVWDSTDDDLSAYIGKRKVEHGCTLSRGRKYIKKNQKNELYVSSSPRGEYECGGDKSGGRGGTRRTGK